MLSSKSLTRYGQTFTHWILGNRNFSEVLGEKKSLLDTEGVGNVLVDALRQFHLEEYEIQGAVKVLDEIFVAARKESGFPRIDEQQCII